MNDITNIFKPKSWYEFLLINRYTEQKSIMKINEISKTNSNKT